MKKYAGSYIAMLLLVGIGFAPGLHAADEHAVVQTLGNWSRNSLQSIESSGTDALQQVVQDKLQKMIQNSMQLQQPQLRMHIRLSDEQPVKFNRGTANNVPEGGVLPKSRVTTSGNKLG